MHQYFAIELALTILQDLSTCNDLYNSLLMYVQPSPSVIFLCAPEVVLAKTHWRAEAGVMTML